MSRVIRVQAGHEYTLHVTFADGVSGRVHLASSLFAPMFEPLRDPALFAQVRIDEYGAVCWPNGADLAPGALRQTVAAMS